MTYLIILMARKGLVNNDDKRRPPWLTGTFGV
jgi:hypothetical protein